MDNLTESRICVEKPLQKEEHMMKHISDRSNSRHHYDKLKTSFLSHKLWPNESKIRISFISSPINIKNIEWTPMALLEEMKNKDGDKIKLDPLEKQIRKLSHVEAVKKVIRDRFEPICGLKFIFVPRGGEIRIGFHPYEGCWSLIGTDCLKASNQPATMNLGWLDCGTIMHQFGHVLGLIHEHNKDNQIEWDEAKLYQWARQTQNWDKNKTYYNIIERYKSSQLNESKFDKDSIMLYYFPSSLTVNNKGTNLNQRLSRGDVNYISKIYPGGYLSPEEFYQKAYGESILEKNIKFTKPKHKKFNWEIILYIIITIVGILIIYIIINHFKNKRKSKYRLLTNKKIYIPQTSNPPRKFV
jgi:hypothetical protein